MTNGQGDDADNATAEGQSDAATIARHSGSDPIPQHIQPGNLYIGLMFRPSIADYYAMPTDPIIIIGSLVDCLDSLFSLND